MTSRLRNVLLIVALPATLAAHALGQGTFQNLNFEEAVLVPVPGDPPGDVEFAQAFPGWTGHIGGQVQTRTFPNGVPIGQTFPFIAIMSPPLWTAPEGGYEVGFGAGLDGSGSLIPVALAQNGQVPAGAMSLEFLALYAPAVFLGGQQLSSVRLGSGPSTRSLFGVDISGFAGQTLELRFQPGLGIDYLDAIQFSSQIIPEPSTFGLFVLGGLLFCLPLRTKRRP